MALYLDELWVSLANKDKIKENLAKINESMVKGPLPRGVTVKAGPWFSAEEAKIIVVLDIQDHARTYRGFNTAMSTGVVERRRLTAIVDGQVAQQLIG